jgi:hypothetical protein
MSAIDLIVDVYSVPAFAGMTEEAPTAPAGVSSAISPLSSAVGVGGHPGMRRSTGTTSATLPATA